MPTATRKKVQLSPAQSNTLLNHFAKAGQPPSPPLVKAGQTQASPLVISDDEDEPATSTSTRHLKAVQTSRDDSRRNRSRSSPSPSVSAEAGPSLAPRESNMHIMREGSSQVQREIENMDGGTCNESAEIDDQWNNESEEGMGMGDPEDDADLYVDLTGEPYAETEGSEWDTDNEGLDYERPSKRKLQDDILDLRECGQDQAEGSSRRPISSFCLSAGQTSKKAATSDGDMGPPKSTPKGPNAFTMLMQNKQKEEADWRTAEIDLRRDGTRVSGRRKAPFYKVSAILG